MRRVTKAVAASALLLLAVVLPGGVLRASAAEAPIGLGRATSYAILGGTTVTNTGSSVINGDLGLSPGTAVTGFPPGQVNNGSSHIADGAAADAQTDLTTAYNDAAGRSTTGSIVADLGGQTLVPGVYAGGALTLNGTLTLDAQGDPAAVFVFKASSSLTTGSASVVSLIGGANACNVFWQVTSSATLGSNSTFRGTILAMTSITATTGASVTGRLLARNGAVTLDTNNVSISACAAASTTTTSSSTTTSTSTSTTSTTAVTPTTVTTPTPSANDAGTPTVTQIPTSATVAGPPVTELPRTGGRLADLAIAGVLAIAAGAAIVSVSRRRAVV